ncbi:hypothetical protein ACFT5B_14150 [Luteimicrobium sp. NPDC057192]|uniref:hypothetical protein n=1 Tax=Luteimicrobium sp. NPDC057192 TaxID=3346042 RepID=UPI0036430ABE
MKIFTVGEVLTAQDLNANFALVSKTIAAADFFAPVAGLTIASGSVEVIADKSIVWELQLNNSGGPSLAAGAQSIALGNINAPFKPRTYYSPFIGWPGSGACFGLVNASTGQITVRWSDAAHATPAFVLGGSWPI